MTNEETQLTAPTPSAVALPFDYTQFQGSGFENADAKKDLSVPYLEILQTNSKALVEGSAKYRPGARAGMFLNTGTGQLIDGRTGFAMVPLHIDHCVVEWTDQRKFVARRGLDDAEWLAGLERFNSVKDPKKKLSKDVKSSAGNQLVETYYLWALLLADDGKTPVGGAILPFKSTNIAIYRNQVYTPLFSFKLPGGPKLYAHRLRCTLAREERSEGNSFNYRFAPLNGVVANSLVDDAALMNEAHQTHLLIAGGKAKMAEPDVAEGETSPAPADEVFS